MRSCRQRVWPGTLNGSDIIAALAISSVPTKLLPSIMGLVKQNRVRYKMEAFKIKGIHISGNKENHPGSSIYADKTSLRPMAKPCTILYIGGGGRGRHNDILISIKGTTACRPNLALSPVL